MFESKKTIEMWVSCGDDYFYGINGEKKDMEMAVSFYEKAAKKKHARATFMLGLCYELGGKGLKKDLKTAEAWYQQAAEYGDEDAKKRLETGETIVPSPPPEDDDDVEDDETESEDADEEEDDADDEADDDEEAAEPGKGGETYFDDDIDVDLRTLSADLLNKIGNDYIDGDNGKEENKEKAMRYYLKAAEMGDVFGMCNVGRGYYYGTGVEEDNHKAEHWLKQAAEGCIKSSFYPLGEIYHKGFTGEVDFQKAAYWYEKAATIENIDTSNAREALANLYADGECPEADPVKADWWAKYIAGDSEAENIARDLYIAYRDGENGFEKDMDKAAYFAQKLAMCGNMSGMSIFASMCSEKEEYPAWYDPKEAVYWYQKATDLGSEDAKRELALMYLNGEGVERDIEQSIKLLEGLPGSAEKGIEKVSWLLQNASGRTQTISGKVWAAYYNIRSDVPFDFNSATSEQLYTIAEYIKNTSSIDKAINYYEIAAMRGHVDAMFMCGAYYGSKCGNQFDGSVNRKKNFHWLATARANDHAKATELCNMVEKGMTPSIAANNQFTANQMYEMGDQYEQKNDFIRAMYWYKQAAIRDKRHDSAAYRTGKCYFHGTGTWKNGKIYSSALKYFLQAAEHSKGHQEYYIGRIYFEGTNKVKQDYKEALKWFKKAVDADKPDYWNYQYLADTYRKLGDIKNADKWDEKAQKVKK